MVVIDKISVPASGVFPWLLSHLWNYSGDATTIKSVKLFQACDFDGFQSPSPSPSSYLSLYTGWGKQGWMIKDGNVGVGHMTHECTWHFTQKGCGHPPTKSRLTHPSPRLYGSDMPYCWYCYMFLADSSSLLHDSTAVVRYKKQPTQTLPQFVDH